jgi:hypothetical protein
MDSSLQSANLAADEQTISVVAGHEAGIAEEEHHIHLPNPSVWPLILSVAILVAIVGLLFIPDSPWLLIVAVPFVLLGIMGWALEDPMAPPQEQQVASQEAGVPVKYPLGQDVVDQDGNWLGTVQARFSRYILVDNGELFVRAYYIPQSLIEENPHNGALRLTVSEADLLRRGLDRVPADLHEEEPEFGFPQTRGTPMFARGPLSPAETGHYNYGPNSPGINTDAAGSYRPEEVRPIPQKYVADRRALYTTRKPIPPRVVSSN